jgi:hypothetical protein
MVYTVYSSDTWQEVERRIVIGSRFTAGLGQLLRPDAGCEPITMN